MCCGTRKPPPPGRVAHGEMRRHECHHLGVITWVSSPRCPQVSSPRRRYLGDETQTSLYIKYDTRYIMDKLYIIQKYQYIYIYTYIYIKYIET